MSHTSRKYLPASVILVFLVILSGITLYFSKGYNSDIDIISSGKNFKVYDITKDNQPEYRYEIYNDKGEIVKSETVWRIEPHIEYLDDNTLLSIRISVGTGTALCQYYDVKTGVFSEIFESVKSAEYGKVVYMDSLNNKFKLIVRDIFDKLVYYNEFELDFSPIANPSDVLLDVKFLNENTLQVSYLSGDEYDEKTTIIKLD
jgi:hypothetical protein